MLETQYKVLLPHLKCISNFAMARLSANGVFLFHLPRNCL